MGNDFKIFRKKVSVNGIVQGVGFRPFVYSIACENNLKGYVKNTCKGVVIDIEGEEKNIDKFLNDLKDKPPDTSEIIHIDIRNEDIVNYKEFRILESGRNDKGQTLICPDLAICDKCKKELFSEDKKRRYLYSFINCTDCGPRFTIAESLPYDRANTTMNEFEMCTECREEYYNPTNRRFHAEPVCCSKCGPKLELISSRCSYEKYINVDVKHNERDILKECREYIKKGKIIAVKGIGGFNLICDGKDKTAVDRLRKRKNRLRKPLAVMMRDIESVNKYCFINDKEKEILTGRKMPIVLLKQKKNTLPENIAYKNKKIGVLLPYSPLHCLLFDEEIEIIVFTSGNISGSPREYKNDDAVNKLKDIADYFLVHNRKINMPIDDSVVKVNLNSEIVLRSGRGYAPVSIKNKSKRNILALGAQQKNTFTLNNKDFIFISPYIGNISSLESLENFKRNMVFFQDIYKIKADAIAYDMHPDYWSQSFLKEISDKNTVKVGVYHHHAHIVSAMFENNIKEDVIGIAFDGTGYGDDKNLWGSEFLICSYKTFKRAGHIKYMKMTGKESAVKYPWKMAVSIIHDAAWKTDIKKEYDEVKDNLKDIDFNLYKTLCTMYDKDINSCMSSSIGRLFDGIGSLLGFHGNITYEGECAVYVENLAKQYIDADGKIIYRDFYDYEICMEDYTYIIDTGAMIVQVLDDLKKRIDKSVIAIRFHNTIIEICVEMCEKLKNIYGINTVVLSGGVFQNDILFINLYLRLIENKFKVFTNKKVPCNDSGISLGQWVIADENLNN